MVNLKLVMYMCDFETEKINLWINHIKTIYSCIICGEKFNAYSGTTTQNRDRGIDDYHNHVRKEHPEIIFPFMRSDDRVSESSASSESSDSSESMDTLESTDSSEPMDSSDS